MVKDDLAIAATLEAWRHKDHVDLTGSYDW